MKNFKPAKKKGFLFCCKAQISKSFFESPYGFNGFNEEVTDVAGGLLVRKKDAFVAIGPDLMRLKHNNGQWKNPESISTGYAVHIGFGGHGMSSLTEGPDGKIYWQIGDIGANITAKDGKNYKHPNSGVIVRSNPDGSEFEVYASGLRNTHEFVFDNYGNLISSDNDGDHPGESERLVHVVEGSDAGWRSNWQYGKYTDPRNNLYKVWMDEKLYVPRWDGQAAYIIPPIRNFHNGPTGMLWNPGTALGKRWTNKFFLVEFVGNANMSHIWSFDLKPKGASFEFKTEEDVTRILNICDQDEHLQLALIYAADFEAFKKTFRELFTEIMAAGGVVKNEDKDLLLIFRKGKWDLPKRKADEGEKPEETAIREVKEETGLQSVLLIKKLTVTQHTYLQDSIQFIKETHWYLMSATTLENKTLTPQLEEEIEKIEWIDIDLLPPYLEDSYPTIRQVLSLL